ncbi:hypothetical protein PILCRDRAFT_86447 [Piloderma croceum F 1598]|uniref:Uncharacterized protein n=1 Tax=Piloderma croceum (strain F 1598) TaxID=765440 RepID=A0A0C3BKB2_PILCF|nr:hypothetical protein PILCRDRAFT_86447 [Piloderma croceum F 1598]
MVYRNHFLQFSLSMPKDTSYYARYNALKRVGRRKISLEDRAACEDKRRREMEGSRSTTSDPEQTDHMHTVAREAWTNALFLLIDLWRLYGEDNWDEYTPPYLDNIRILLKDELAGTNTFLNSTPDHETLHLYRRIIAFYHQEIELRGQGEAAWQSAVEDEALVMYGRSCHLGAPAAGTNDLARLQCPYLQNFKESV